MTSQNSGADQYKKLKDKYGLPGLQELEREFSLGAIEENQPVLRQILVKMNEKQEEVLKLLKEVIQPENNFPSLYEAESFDEEEKKNVFELFKKISCMNKELIITDLDYDEKKAANQIIKTLDEWKVHKPELLKIVNKTRASWKNKKKTRLDLEYFG